MLSELLKEILALVGPLLGKALLKWLESLFDKSAKKIELTGDREADVRAVFAAALKKVPRYQLFRRALIYRLADVSVKVLATGAAPSAWELTEVKNLVAGVKAEAAE